MNDAVLPYLRCPNCSATLSAAGPRVVRCARGHSFDVAKQGYLTLTAGRAPHPGDSAAMVDARAEFLAAGHYDAVAGALAACVPPTGGLILDAGTGTGFYLARVLGEHPYALGLGLDVSKPALRRAARAHPRAAAVLADLWRPLPVADDAATVIVNVFAPRNGPEFHRVLAPDGVLVVVTPAADHLHELITGYGLISVDPDKPERVRTALGEWFVPAESRRVSRTMSLTGAEVRTLVGMTPSARHITNLSEMGGSPPAARDGGPEGAAGGEEAARDGGFTVTTAGDGGFTVTAAVDVTTWRPVQTERSTSSQSGGSP
jgi:23S rRNA (guanine745-N1)-methyltransferase